MSDLLTWYAQHGRHDLPWRKTRDPYRILVSELMLQQTQVPRVIPKYEAFIKRFPTLQALAKAERQEVLQAWQGLGYNSRAVRLHALAKVGKLPKTREELLKLPGIGPYTAGAIMIFAHNTPSLSVDVNVERVLKRLYYTKAQRPTKTEVNALAEALIAKHPPHDWQSALMDFGSAVCTAKPRCDACPLKQCKSKGARPDEVKTTQPRFAGSIRWWRGQILKKVLEGPVPASHLLYRIKAQPTAEDEQQYEQALTAMLKERLLKTGKNVRLA